MTETLNHTTVAEIEDALQPVGWLPPQSTLVGLEATVAGLRDAQRTTAEALAHAEAQRDTARSERDNVRVLKNEATYALRQRDVIVREAIVEWAEEHDIDAESLNELMESLGFDPVATTVEVEFVIRGTLTVEVDNHRLPTEADMADYVSFSVEATPGYSSAATDVHVDGFDVEIESCTAT